MTLLIGMDEAGYGPNLGPLVITATAWDITDEDPSVCDLWKSLQEVVCQQPIPRDNRLHIADSKQVFSPAKGLASLELTVLSLLRWSGHDVSSFKKLWRQLAVTFPGESEQEPWFCDDLTLPTVVDEALIEQQTDGLENCARRSGVTPPHIKSEVVLTARFNRLTSQYDSKGRTLSTLSLALLAILWQPRTGSSAYIVADKHGGRNRYDDLIAEILDGEMIFRIEEGRERSVYRVGRSEIRFQMKAESHFPVAVASLISKYLRELSMLAFNRFWRTHLPQIKPTQGYPLDAKRFRAEITECQTALNISNDILWRDR